MKKIFYLNILLICSNINLKAQWNNNTAINTAICTATGSQVDPRGIEDDKGGAYIAWKDSRTGVPDIYIQRLDANGNIKFTANGIGLCTNTADQSTPAITSDMKGGAIVAWSDWRSNVERDIYAQRIDSNGNILWQVDGAIVTNKSNREHNEKIISDGNGGCIIVWEQQNAGLWDIWAQHLDANGNALWASGGKAMCTFAGNKLNPKVQADGKGGAIISWQDERIVGNFDIYCQRVTATGILQWGANGKAICTASGVQTNAKIDPDANSGGIFISWIDKRNGLDYDIYAQKIDSLGNAQWTTNGVAVCNAVGNQSAIDILSNNLNGELIATWKDARNGKEDIYAQKLNANGLAQWTANGIAIANSSTTEINPNICSNKMGGAIITWQDSTATGWNLKAQHINNAGAKVWTTLGADVCTAMGAQEDCKNIGDNVGGSIFIWKDKRSGTNDIYAHKITGFALAMDALAQEKIVKVYPNPTTNKCTMEWQNTQTQNIDINIYNVQGVLVKNICTQKMFNFGMQNLSIDMPLANGIYFIKLQSLHDALTIKIVKQ